MSVFTLQINDYFIENLEIRLYKLYESKKNKYYIYPQEEAKAKTDEELKAEEAKKKEEKNKEEKKKEDELKAEEAKTDEEDKVKPEEAKTDEELKAEEAKKKEEEKQRMYDEYIKSYIIENVKVIIPNHGKILVNILDNLINWSEFVSLTIAPEDVSTISQKIQLSEIATYTSTIYIMWNELIAQYCWYAFAIYFEKYVAPNVVMTDWLSQYLTIETVWSQYYKIDFDKIPSGIPIPTYNDLINVPVPDSIGLLNRSDSGNYYVAPLGGMTSSAILSSLLFTRKKIIDMGNGLMSLKSSLIATAGGLTALQNIVGTTQTKTNTNTSDITAIKATLDTTSSAITTLTNSITSLQSSITSNTTSINSLRSSNTSSAAAITTLRNSINDNSSNISSLQASMEILSSNMYILQSTVNTQAKTISDLQSVITKKI